MIPRWYLDDIPIYWWYLDDTWMIPYLDHTSMIWLYGPFVSTLRTCLFPYVPFKTPQPCSMLGPFFSTIAWQAWTNPLYNCSPTLLSMFLWYCMTLPFIRPPSVACGMMRTSPGSSRTETIFPSSASLSRTLRTVLAVNEWEHNTVKLQYNTITSPHRYLTVQ